MQQLIKRTPIPTAGLALGLAALGNLIQPLSEILRLICGSISLLLVALLMAKVLLYPSMIRQDLKNPILASVSATLMMALMQLSTYVIGISPVAAATLWICAVAAHITLMIWFAFVFFRKFKLDQVFPTYFICYVGIIVASVTSPQFGFERIGEIFFWFGFACFIPLAALITIRYAKHPVPEAARPLFCIYSAPASLSLVGYLAVTPEPNVGFVLALLVVAQLLFLFVVTRVPRFISLGFFPSFAAMTFPFVITATALFKSSELFSSLGFELPMICDLIVAIEIAFACAMVVFVLGKYLGFLLSPIIKDLVKSEVLENETAE